MGRDGLKNLSRWVSVKLEGKSGGDELIAALADQVKVHIGPASGGAKEVWFNILFESDPPCPPSNSSFEIYLNGNLVRSGNPCLRSPGKKEQNPTRSPRNYSPESQN